MPLRPALARIVAVWLLLAGVVAAHSAAAAPPAGWSEWLSEFRAEAAAKGIGADTLDRALNGLEPVAKILERDRSQAEFTMTLPTYLKRVVTDDKIVRGREMAAAHRALLAQVSQRYGVQPRFILAIWGVESWYGRYTGKDPVVASLATLAFDRRRSSFFRKQLHASLEMVERGYFELDAMKGSWAGAMGQPQFIPTSYLAYAVDEDGDGRRDIWHSLPDIFGSIANYLAQHGWDPNRTWGREVRLPADLRQRWASVSDDNQTAERGLQAWAAAGVRRADGSRLPVPDLPTRIVAPDGADGLAFATYANYRRILRYNPSHLYGLAIGRLSDAIVAQ